MENGIGAGVIAASVSLLPRRQGLPRDVLLPDELFTLEELAPVFCEISGESLPITAG